MPSDPVTTDPDRPVFPERLTRVAKAIWDQYPVRLPAWDELPEYMGNGDVPGRAEFREMARGALEAEGIVIDD